MDINRRQFVITSLSLISTLPFVGMSFPQKRFKPIRFGIVTDIHYANRDPKGSKYYRESFGKLSECVDLMNKEKVDFLIELGDFKDEGNPPNEEETLRFLTIIEKEFSRFEGPRYHVLGNHDHDTISKQQFLDHITNAGFDNALNYYSFNKNSFHFIVLDANYTSKGVAYDRRNFHWKDCHIPQDQIDWLKKDLKRHRKIPTIVFVHQRLDSPVAAKAVCPNNANAVREVLNESGNVLIVFQGHDHKGGLSQLDNIYYYTLPAVVEGNGMENNHYAIVEINQDKVVHIHGYRKVESQLLR